MENIVLISIFLSIIILLRFIFKANYKKAKELENNKNLQKITDRFPENIDIAKEMLCMINNKDVKIEEAKDTKTSLYIAISNKIVIADMKNNYARIQTIAHECLHSIQDRTMLIFNFVFSNITIVYWIVAVVLTICNVFKNTLLQTIILILLYFIQTIVRAYLETDAMIKARFFAEDYMKEFNKKSKICTEEEIEEITLKYDEMNKIGIPAYNFILVKNTLMKPIIYTAFVILIKLIHG